MFKIKLMSISSPIYINWNNFDINDIPENFDGTCNIYIDKLDGNVEEDLRKIGEVKKILGLKEIVISTSDPRIAIYFDSLMKEIDTKKVATILNDYEVSSRDDIDFSETAYSEITVPFDYIMYIKKDKPSEYTDHEILRDGCMLAGKNDSQRGYDDLQDQILNIIDEIFHGLPIDELNDIDKSVLVSNWIQKNMQFVSGRVSTVQGKKYICDDYSLQNGGTGDVNTLINKKYGKCTTIAKLTVALLNNPIVNCKAHVAYSQLGSHTYVVQIIDGKEYLVDNTWCITRNPKKIEGALKATEFSDRYLLVGQDKINESEETKIDHTNTGCHKFNFSETGISREKIEMSIKKLKEFGIDFSYSGKPALASYIEEEPVIH